MSIPLACIRGLIKQCHLAEIHAKITRRQGRKGIRIMVELIPDKLAAGETVEQILEAHPRSPREGIQAALPFPVRQRIPDLKIVMGEK
jgi:uncharacterized protein (DUF433 family)